MSPQSTWKRNWFIIFASIGPRQITGTPGSISIPMEMNLDPVGPGGSDPVASGVDGRAAFQAEHSRDVGAIYVGVDQPHSGSFGDQGDSEIGGDRRLADPPLCRSKPRPYF